MNDLFHKLEEIHKLCSEIEPDSIKLYEILSAKPWSDEEGFQYGSGSDMALTMEWVLRPLAEAFREAYDGFRLSLIAEHISTNPDNYTE